MAEKHPWHNASNRDCPWAMGGDTCKCPPPETPAAADRCPCDSGHPERCPDAGMDAAAAEQPREIILTPNYAAMFARFMIDARNAGTDLNLFGDFDRLATNGGAGDVAIAYRD